VNWSLLSTGSRSPCPIPASISGRPRL